MKNSKKIVIIGLLIIILITLIYRYPTQNHEIGHDSYEMHAIANSITSNGYYKSFIHPLSFFGLYPYSYPSGALFTLSAVNQLTGINTEHSILISITLLSILSCIAIYILSREIWNNHLFAFSSALIYSLSKPFLGFTSWTWTTRGAFISLLPIVIFLMLKVYKTDKNQKKYIFLFCIVFLAMASIHRIFFFLFLIGIVSIISLGLFRIISKKRDVIRITKKQTGLIYLVITIVLFVLYLLPLTDLSFFGTPSRDWVLHKGERYFFSGDNILIYLLNFGIWYSIQFGILTIFIPFGYIATLKKVNRKFSNLLFLSIFFLFSFFWVDNAYAITFIGLFVAMLCALGMVKFWELISKKYFNKNISKLLVTITLILFIAVPFVMTIEHSPEREEKVFIIRSPIMLEETYNTGIYLKYKGNGMVFSNEKLITRRLDAYSESNPHNIPTYFDKSGLKPVALNELISGKAIYFWEEEIPFMYRDLPQSVLYRETDCFSSSVRTKLKAYFNCDKEKYYIVDMIPIKNKICSENHITGELHPYTSSFLVDLESKTYTIYKDEYHAVRFLNFG